MRLHEAEHRKGHDEKVQDGVDEIADHQGTAPGQFYGHGGQGGVVSGDDARMGLRISLTREVVMLLKAPPMMTPTAISSTFPLAMNWRNSARKPVVLFGKFSHGTLLCEMNGRLCTYAVTIGAQGFQRFDPNGAAGGAPNDPEQAARRSNGWKRVQRFV